jgi:hypothetical protein
LEDLITELIDNDFDKRVLRKRKEETIKQEAAIGKTGVGVLDTSRQLTAATPTKRRKPTGRSIIYRVLAWLGRSLLLRNASRMAEMTSNTGFVARQEKSAWVNTSWILILSALETK